MTLICFNLTLEMLIVDRASGGKLPSDFYKVSISHLRCLSLIVQFPIMLAAVDYEFQSHT